MHLTVPSDSNFVVVLTQLIKRKKNQEIISCRTSNCTLLHLPGLGFLKLDTLDTFGWAYIPDCDVFADLCDCNGKLKMRLTVNVATQSMKVLTVF